MRQSFSMNRAIKEKNLPWCDKGFHLNLPEKEHIYLCKYIGQFYSVFPIFPLYKFAVYCIHFQLNDKAKFYCSIVLFRTDRWHRVQTSLFYSCVVNDEGFIA